MLLNTLRKHYKDPSVVDKVKLVLGRHSPEEVVMEEVDGYGWIPLHELAYEGACCEPIELLELLLGTVPEQQLLKNCLGSGTPLQTFACHHLGYQGRISFLVAMLERMPERQLLARTTYDPEEAAAEEAAEVGGDASGDVIPCDPDGETPLMIALRHNQPTCQAAQAMVEIMLQYCPEEQLRVTSCGHTPLMIAAKNHKAELIPILLRHIPAEQLDARDLDGNTALLLALIGANAGLDQYPKPWMIPEWKADETYRYFADTISVLLHHGPPSAPDATKALAILLEVMRKGIQAEKRREQVEYVEVLIAAGAELPIRDEMSMDILRPILQDVCTTAIVPNRMTAAIAHNVGQLWSSRGNL